MRRRLAAVLLAASLPGPWGPSAPGVAAALVPVRAAVSSDAPARGWPGPPAPGCLRIVTLNVADGVCSSADKSEGSGRWCALARLVAALAPDVLLLQEAGDNAGNGTGDGVDGVSGLEAALALFVSGGIDPFTPGTPPVGAYVRKYAPQVELPHVAVSTRTDGYNRNALLSRHPFADLNGDGRAVQSDMPPVQAVDWAAGGSGGLRGWLLVEIDLPDATWAGDLVVGNSHLKAGTTASDHAARVDAARNASYYVEHVLNGAGTGMPDPDDAVDDVPAVQVVLDAWTAVVVGGDWNEDAWVPGALKGPAAWYALAETGDRAGGVDGPDRDGSDLRVAPALDPFTGSLATHFGTVRDYLAYQDALGTAAQAFVFDSASLPPSGRATPAPLLGFADGWAAVSGAASDHRAVVVDLALPVSARRLR